MESIITKSNEDKIKLLLEWMKLYVEAIIVSLNPSGDVLEIGFGMGFAAEGIQNHHPKSHTIVEANPELFDVAVKWADKNPNIRVLQGEWQNILPTLGSFDSIFFNGYPLEAAITFMNFLFSEEMQQSSNQSKELLQALEEKMSQSTVKFSDQDIEDFYQKNGQFHLKEMPKFFLKLKDNGNISETQYENAAKKYQFNEIETEKTSTSDETDNTMYLFLEECLKNHMHKGSRFSSFLYNQSSKYEDSQIFENVITNPDLDYKETSVPIKMSDKTREALVILVEKIY